VAIPKMMLQMLHSFSRAVKCAANRNAHMCNDCPAVTQLVQGPSKLCSKLHLHWRQVGVQQVCTKSHTAAAIPRLLAGIIAAHGS
jgi:3-methyladenine DNA glycosylase Mpg